jgi:hypothetical protein
MAVWSAVLCSCSHACAVYAQDRTAPVSLTWHAPVGCPTQQDVIAQLERSEPALPALTIDARIARARDDFVLSLNVVQSGQRFERKLHGAACALLAESAVWLVRLAASQFNAARGADDLSGPSTSSTANAEAPERDATSLQSTRASAPRAAAATSSPSRQRATVNREQAPTHADSRTRIDYRVGLGLGLIALGLGGPAPAGSAVLGADFESFDIELRTSIVFHPSLDVATAEVTPRTFQLLLSGCTAWGNAWLRAGPCAVASTQLTFVAEEGLVHARTATALWLNAGAAGRLRLRIDTAWSLTLEAGLTFALTPRPDIQVNETSLARATRATSYVQLGSAIELP